jgi:hypothetical protein
MKEGQTKATGSARDVMFSLCTHSRILFSRPVVNVIQFFLFIYFFFFWASSMSCVIDAQPESFLPTLCVTDTPTFPIIFWDFSFYYCRFGFIDGAIYTWCIRPGVTRQPVWRTRRGDKKKIRRERVFSYLSIALRRQFTFGMIFISLYT